MTAVLEMSDVHAGYGPFRALFGVSLSVQPGEAVAVVGPNGVGKTTLARVATGLVQPSRGTVLVEGRDFTRSRTYQFARAGVAHAPERRSTFGTLTVEENLELSIRRIRGGRGVRAGLEEAYSMFPTLGQRRNQHAGTLSGGEQRMLAMVRVLVDPPKLLVADELSLGLAPLVTEQVYEMLRQVRDNGTSLLVIEQHVSHALKLCDRVVLLDHGSVSWTGPASEAGDRVQSQLGVPAAS